MIRTPSTDNLRRRQLWDKVMLGLLILGSLIVVAPLVLVLGKVFVTGLSAINLAFFTQDFQPVDVGGGGLRHAIVGTVLMNLLALLIGGTLGLAGGILLSE
jgi:phosphate transport system permease protein